MKKNRQLRAALFFLALAVILTAVVVTSVPALRNLLTPPEQQFLQQGDAFLVEGRLPEAVLSYRQAVNANPNSQPSVRALAEAYTRQGRLRSAEALLQQLDPDLAPALFALPPVDPAAGLQPAWMIRPNQSVPTGAALQERRLFIAYENGWLAAVDLPDGALSWNQQVSNQVLAIPSADSRWVYVGDAGGTLSAVSAQDGSLAWRVQMGAPLFAAPLIMDRTLYLPSSDGSLYALDTDSGSLRWQYKTAGALHAAPAAEGEVLYVGSNDGKLYALSLADGSPKWQDGFQTNGAVESQPVTAQGRVLFGSADGRVYSLASDSGGMYWRYSTADGVFASPLVAAEMVYISSSGHTLSAVDFNSGARRWETELPGALRHPAVLLDGRLYVITEADPQIYILDAADGRILAAVNSGDWTSGGPWLQDGMLYLLGRDGAVLAYRLD